MIRVEGIILEEKKKGKKIDPHHVLQWTSGSVTVINTDHSHGSDK